jgi:hypothetical protein
MYFKSCADLSTRSDPIHLDEKLCAEKLSYKAKRKTDVKCSRRKHEKQRQDGKGRQRLSFFPVYDADPADKTMETLKEHTVGKSWKNCNVCTTTNMWTLALPKFRYPIIHRYNGTSPKNVSLK